MRIAPFCRLVHLATMDFVFKVLVLIPPVIPPFATIFVIYVGAYTLVAWVMCLLLDDMDVPLGRCEAQARAEAGASDPAAYAEAVEEVLAVFLKSWAGIGQVLHGIQILRVGLRTYLYK